MAKILIVEDDPVISRSIMAYTKTWGYDVRCVEDFKDIMPLFVDFSPQLVLMDISLPYYNGYHWCKVIRELSTVPIIFISSASDNMNIVMAVNMGGDDFLAKPFDLNVLNAKIQAILRRTYDFTGQTDLIEHCGVILNKSDASVSYKGEKQVLTKNEYRILLCLMQKNSTIVSRDELMEKLWETDSFVDENTLTVNITRLRKKLENIGLKDFIVTKKGTGYMVI